jgi:hypothetical protein
MAATLSHRAMVAFINIRIASIHPAVRFFPTLNAGTRMATVYYMVIIATGRNAAKVPVTVAGDNN